MNEKLSLHSTRLLKEKMNDEERRYYFLFWREALLYLRTSSRSKAVYIDAAKT